MLMFLDNCPIFVLQPLRGKTGSHCEEIYHLWYAKSSLTLGPETVSWIHYGSSALLISPHAPETLFFQRVFFRFVEMSCMKTQWQADTSDASQGSVLGPMLFRIFINSLGNKMECTLGVSMDGPKLRGVEGMWKHYWAAIQKEINRPQD